MSEKPLINVHIEKTAGRSLRSVLVDSFGADQVLLYNPITDRVIRTSESVEKKIPAPIERWRNHGMPRPVERLGYFVAGKLIEQRKSFAADDLPDEFKVIAGHFRGDRFLDAVSPEDSKYISILREPLARMRSHYEHWMRTRGMARFRDMPSYAPDMSFEEFALLPQLQNFQTQALAIDPHRYHLIGVIDRLDLFLEEAGFSVEGSTIPSIGISDYDKDHSIYPEDFIAMFYAMHEQDLDLYEDIRAQWT